LPLLARDNRLVITHLDEDLPALDGHLRARMLFLAVYDAGIVGRFARRVIGADRAATVVARFARSIYVRNRCGLACIGDPGLGHGPLNVIVRAIRPWPPVGAVVRVRLGGAQTWKPDAPPLMQPGALCRGLASIGHVSGRGLFAQRDTDPAIAALRQWIAARATGRAPRAVSGLIGRGPGLTPAGDDLVGGALVALRALRLHARADRLGRWALRKAQRGSSRISRAHLACAAAGEGGAPLHALIAALLSGTRDASRELAAIDAVGHTSGWDAAAGAVLVLRCAIAGIDNEEASRSG